MKRYIDADRLREKITDRLDLFKELSSDTISPIRIDECKQIIDIIDSIQQDETQVDRMLCSQVWWEEQGWIMIPPDATIEGIDSLLRQVKKKLQQEQPESSKGKFVFPKFLYARTTNNKTIDVSYAPQSLDAIEYIRKDALMEWAKKEMEKWSSESNTAQGVKMGLTLVLDKIESL